MENISVNDIGGYTYTDAGHNESHRYLFPAVLRILDQVKEPDKSQRIFEVGCGNGSVASELSARGYNVTGIDPSAEGISQARRANPALKLEAGSCYDDLAAKYGRFPLVLSLEVVEHVYFPRQYAACVFSLLESGGTAIISTPYHGYLKNLAMAVTGKLDAHFTALWDHGHIKFWSMRTMTDLLTEAGFRSVTLERVGRIPALAKSMIAIARKA